MADSSVEITAGSGTPVDTRTVGTGDHRQVVVLGDPTTNTGVAPVDVTYGLAVDVKRSELPSGAATAARQDTGNTSLSSIDGKVTACNTGAVVVSSSALPSGAATSANQDTGNASLSSIDGKTPALGQALAAASVPVVLTAAQVSTLTPPAAITGFATESTLSTLNGKVTAVNTGAVVVSSSALPSGASTLAEQQSQTTSLQLIDDAIATTASAITSKGMAVSGTDGTNARVLKTDSSGELQVDVLSMPTTTVTGTVAATQSGTWNVTNVSGTVSLPTGASTEATLSTLNGKVTACNTGAVTISAALPAGTNAIGKLSANSGVDIGDVDITSIVPGTSATSLGKAEDAAHTTGDTGVMLLAVRNDSAATFAGTTGDYSAIAVNSVGAVQINIDAGSQTGTSLIRSEDAAASTGQPGVPALFKRTDALASQTSTDGDYSLPTCNAHGAMYTDPIRRGTFTHTQPTIANTTSVTLVASNAERRYLLIQNNSAANILVSLNNDTLTGIAPTSTNLGIVIAAGAAYESPPNACPTAAVTVYQSSGGSINTVSVIEGS